MILSMTGYGKSVANFNGKKIHVEIKSLNSKALDLSTRITPLYREKEIEIRNYIATELERGKVDFVLWVEKDETQSATPINTALVLEYYKQIKELSATLNLDMSGLQTANEWMKTLLRMPEVLTRTETEELTDEEWAIAFTAVKEAVANLVEFRKQEGAALAKKFQEKIDNISALLASIEPFEKERTEKIRQRIISNLTQFVGIDYDNNRLEQEMIYYIEKLDISEEKQRLTNHLNYFRETMAEPEGGQGKKLGFIAQLDIFVPHLEESFGFLGIDGSQLGKHRVGVILGKGLARRFALEESLLLQAEQEPIILVLRIVHLEGIVNIIDRRNFHLPARRNIQAHQSVVVLFVLDRAGRAPDDSDIFIIVFIAAVIVTIAHASGHPPFSASAAVIAAPRGNA